MGKTRYPQSTEAQVQKAIIQYMQLHGWWITHIPGGGKDPRHRRRMARAGYVAGTPDLLCVSRTGDVLLIEVKGPKGRLSLDQQVVVSELQDRGCPVLVAHGLDDVISYLEVWPG